MNTTVLRTTLLAVAVLSLSNAAKAGVTLFYQGSGYDLLADPPLMATDIICGAVTFPMPLPTTDGAAITPTSVLLQTSQNGTADPGFSSSAIITNNVTWSATNGLPDTWVLQVGSLGVNQLQIQKDSNDEGDTASLSSGTVLGLGSVAGTWSPTLPAACNTGVHPDVAAIPEPSGFLCLSLLAIFVAGGRRLVRRRKRCGARAALHQSIYLPNARSSAPSDVR